MSKSSNKLDEQIAWQNKLPLKVIHAIAQAHTLSGVYVNVLSSIPNKEAKVIFVFSEQSLGYEHKIPVYISEHPASCTQEHEWQDVELSLNHVFENFKKEQAKKELREKALAKLTKEEREALDL